MPRYRIDLAYDGSEYAGWQIQPSKRTVQHTLERVLAELWGEKVKIHGSGRTDQGVHARHQVAHFDLRATLRPEVIVRAMNARLPDDIRIWRARIVPPTFHARRDVVSKEYRYFIWNGSLLPPWLWRYRTHVRRRLDLTAMGAAAAVLVGRHDFAAFAANPDREVGSTVRELFRLEIRKRSSEVVIVAEGEGFLYRMVRSLAGFLIRVGEGAVAPSETEAILASRVRTARVPTASPQGLFLWKITY